MVTDTSYAGENLITAQTRELKVRYQQRDRYIGSIRELIELADNSDNQFNMERFISNDPRTLWNMATFLLQPRPLINHVTDIDGRELAGEIRTAAEAVEQMLNRLWLDLNESHMGRGGSGLYWEIVGMLAATGWYSVPYAIEPSRVVADYWSPAYVYPEWSDDVNIGLVRVARIRDVSADEARRVANVNNWVWTRYNKNTTVTEHRLWIYDGTNVWFGVSFNNDVVKPLEIVSGLDKIPVVVGGVGGTPSLSTEMFRAGRVDRPQQGASVLDTNRDVYTQLNRQFSFLMQLVHDTANPKTFERSSSGSARIVNSPDEFYTRGAHFRLGAEDELGVIDLPGIPPEGIQMILSIRNMIQRGGFSDTAYGNITGQVTALVISQAAEAAQQIIIPYHQAMEFICTEVSRYWVEKIADNPGRYTFLSDTERAAFELLATDNVNYRVKSEYSVQVPGDTAARIVMAKQASPSFEISAETSMRLFMPEITDPKLEISRVKAARAENHPVFETVRVANAMRESAARLTGVNDGLAQSLIQGANALLAQIGGGQQQQGDTIDALRQDNAAGGALSGISTNGTNSVGPADSAGPSLGPEGA